MDPYEDWKARFVHVKGRYGASMVTTGAIGTLWFPLSRTLDPQLIKCIYYSALSPFGQEVTEILSCFWLLNSCTLIIRDREDYDEVEKYLGKFYGMNGTFWLDPLFYCFTRIKNAFFVEDVTRISLSKWKAIGSDASHTTTGSPALVFLMGLRGGWG